MREVTLSVPDMKCGGCVASVTEALEGLDGTSTVETSLETKRSQVVAEDAVTDADLIASVKSAGFDATVVA